MTQNLESTPYTPLEAGGSAYDRGYAYGTHARDVISRLLTSHFVYYSAHLGTDRTAVLREASSFSRPILEYSWEIYEELRGLAAGAGVSLDEVLTIAAFNEVFYPKLSKLCTSFAVRPKATSDGLTYVGQNNDEGVDPWLDGECVLLVKYREKSAPSSLVYTYAGAPAMMGINSSGVAVCINALRYSAPVQGVPMLCIVREILRQKTTDDAVEVIERARKAYALNFMIGSPDKIANVEATPNGTQVTTSDEALFHANHYLCPVNGFGEKKTGDYYVNSTTRCNRIQEILTEKTGKLNLVLLEEALRDHGGAPNSICSHVNTSKPRERWSRTLDGMIYIPERREAWIAKGNPCASTFYRYSI
jgi:isopenicillin-N N-acyltransferase-like protein